MRKLISALVVPTLSLVLSWGCGSATSDPHGNQSGGLGGVGEGGSAGSGAGEAGAPPDVGDAGASGAGGPGTATGGQGGAPSGGGAGGAAPISAGSGGLPGEASGGSGGEENGGAAGEPTGGTTTTGGTATGGTATGGATATGGTATGGATATGGTATGGVTATGGTATGGAATGGAGGGPSCGAGSHRCGTSCVSDAAPGTEFVHPIYGCGHRFQPSAGSGNWVTFQSGLHVDEKTGYGWYQASGSHTQAEAVTLCASGAVAGLSSGWSLPTINQARTLAAGCADTAAGGSCRIADPACLASACGLDADCSSCLGSAGPHAGSYCRDNVRLCGNLLSSSSCSDCSAPNTAWMYGASNGNFVPVSTNSRYTHLCVRTSVPNY